MRVREAKTSDSEIIQGLVAQLGHPLGVESAKFEAVFQSAVEDLCQVVLVVEDDSSVFGYVSARIHSPLYAQAKVAFVDEIVIDESRRSDGAGSYLMKSLETRLVQSECILCSLATAGAKVFYEGLGYSGLATYLKRSL